jgi:hypothetical protein
VDVMRRAGTPMTALEIADALISGKAPQATRKQVIVFRQIFQLMGFREKHLVSIRISLR